MIKLLNLGLPMEKCWKLWAEGNSYGSISYILYNEGLYNKRTNRPFTQSAIHKAAAHWMLYNLPEAKKDFVHRQLSRGMVITEEEWQEYVAQMARLYFHRRPDSLRKYIAQHGIQDYFKIQSPD